MNSFESKLNSYRNLVINKRKLSSRIGLIRLVIFVVGALVSINIWGGGHRVEAVVCLLCFGLCFVLVAIKHDSIIQEIETIKCKIIINEKYISRSNDSWLEFEDKGEEFINSDHQYSSDLDIFGRGSLFQWLNTAHTYYGRGGLKELFKGGDKTIGRIKDRQKAVLELGNKICYKSIWY